VPKGNDPVSELPNDYKSRHLSGWNPIDSRQRRRLRNSEPKTAAVPLLFETFESRILLDAVLPINPVHTAALPTGTVLASDTQPSTVQDADGTQVSISIAGNGHWQITRQAVAAPALTITGTDAGSAVTITSAGGNNRFFFLPSTWKGKLRR
jgi:hypothetical protein